MENQAEYAEKRYLNQYPILIRSNRAVPIINKVLSGCPQTLDKRVSSQKPFGLRTFVRPDETGNLILRWNGGKGPIKRAKVSAGNHLIDKWNVIVSRVSYEHGGNTDKNGQRRVFSILEILAPGEVCTETYIVVDSFSSYTEAENFESYLRTKFVRFLISQATSSIMVTKSSFIFVPEQEFSKSWTDEKLFEKYGLTDEEVALIISTIKPMEL